MDLHQIIHKDFIEHMWDWHDHIVLESGFRQSKIIDINERPKWACMVAYKTW